jgi:2'-5' RNA ligase
MAIPRHQSASGVRVAEVAIVVLVPEAEPLIGTHRARHTAEGAHGMGAHVTLLYPFTDDDRALAEAAEVVAEFPAFDFTLAAAMRFPENRRVLCLRPEPDAPFRELTTALVRAFPDFPPYGGKYAQVIPHATVAIADDVVLDAIERELAGSLPIAARATEAAVMEREHEDTDWRVRGTIAFA